MSFTHLITLVLGVVSFFTIQVSYAESLTRSFAWPLEVQKLDPHNTSSDTLYALISHYLAPLVEINPIDNSVTPALAEKWTYSEDGKTITLQLRKDAYWSDGVKITAQQVKQSIDRALSVGMRSDAQTLLLPIEGVRERLNSKKNTPLGIEVLGQHTISFRLTYRHPDFMHVLAFPIASPVPTHQIGADAAYPSVEQLSSSGPYRLVKLGKHSAEFAVNEKYFGERPHFETVSFIFDEYQVLIKNFLNETYDTLEYIPVDQMPWLKENMPDSIKITSNNGAFYLVFKDEVSGGFNSLLRQRLLASLDHYRLNNVMTRQYFTTMSGLIPWGAPLPADTAAAKKRRSEATTEVKQMMVKSGYSKESPMKVCINFDKVTSSANLFNLLRAHLGSMYIQLTLGNDFNHDFLASTTDDVASKDLCSIAISGYTSRTRSEEEIILAFFLGGLFYPALANQPELESQYTKMNQLKDLKQRKTALRQMEKYLIEQGYVKALYKTDLISLVNQKNIGNYSEVKSLPFIPVSQYFKP